jgi:hypothetical protein
MARLHPSPSGNPWARTSKPPKKQESELQNIRDERSISARPCLDKLRAVMAADSDVVGSAETVGACAPVMQSIADIFEVAVLFAASNIKYLLSMPKFGNRRYDSGEAE